MGKKVKVVVLDDSVFFRELLAQELNKATYIEVISSMQSSLDSHEKIAELNPDVIILDADLSKNKDVEVFKRFIQKVKKSVIVISEFNLSLPEVLSAGAIGFIKKPDLYETKSIKQFADNLSIRISMAYSTNVRTNVVGSSAKNGILEKDAAVPKMGSGATQIALNPFLKTSKLDTVVIAIGASTGGTEATLLVIQDLPKETPGIVVVQHMPEGFTTMYAERLNKICAMEVKEAENGDEIKRGRVLIARGDFHMEVAGSRGAYRVELKKGEKVSGHRPSVDVLFDSVAKIVKKDAVGIILTGMGKDGADGLLRMRQNGAFTIGQDESSSVVYGMPMVAFQKGAVCKQTKCDNIANVLKEYLSKL